MLTTVTATSTATSTTVPWKTKTKTKDHTQKKTAKNQNRSSRNSNRKSIIHCPSATDTAAVDELPRTISGPTTTSAIIDRYSYYVPSSPLPMGQSASISSTTATTTSTSATTTAATATATATAAPPSPTTTESSSISVTASTTNTTTSSSPRQRLTRHPPSSSLSSSSSSPHSKKSAVSDHSLPQPQLLVSVPHKVTTTTTTRSSSPTSTELSEEGHEVVIHHHHHHSPLPLLPQELFPRPPEDDDGSIRIRGSCSSSSSTSRSRSRSGSSNSTSSYHATIDSPTTYPTLHNHHHHHPPLHFHPPPSSSPHGSTILPAKIAITTTTDALLQQGQRLREEETTTTTTKTTAREEEKNEQDRINEIRGYEKQPNSNRTGAATDTDTTSRTTTRGRVTATTLGLGVGTVNYHRPHDEITTTAATTTTLPPNKREFDSVLTSLKSCPAFDNARRKQQHPPQQEEEQQQHHPERSPSPIPMIPLALARSTSSLSILSFSASHNHEDDAADADAKEENDELSLLADTFQSTMTLQRSDERAVDGAVAHEEERASHSQPNGVKRSNHRIVSSRVDENDIQVAEGQSHRDCNDEIHTTTTSYKLDTQSSSHSETIRRPAAPLEVSSSQSQNNDIIIVKTILGSPTLAERKAALYTPRKSGKRDPAAVLQLTERPLMAIEHNHSNHHDQDDDDDDNDDPDEWDDPQLQRHVSHTPLRRRQLLDAKMQKQQTKRTNRVKNGSARTRSTSPATSAPEETSSVQQHLRVSSASVVQSFRDEVDNDEYDDVQCLASSEPLASRDDTLSTLSLQTPVTTPVLARSPPPPVAATPSPLLLRSPRLFNSSLSKRRRRLPSEPQRMSDLIRMDLWSGDPVIVEKALMELVQYAGDGESNNNTTTHHHHHHRAAIARTGGLLAIVRAMETHIDCPAIQVQACKCLERLALDVDNEHAIDEVGGLEAILDSMLAHSDNVHVQTAAWAALWNVTCDNAGKSLVIDDTPQEGMHVLVECMIQHAHQAEVQKNACGTLANLCLDHEERLAALSDAGGFVAMAQALQTHWHDPDVRNEASYALTVLLSPRAQSYDVQPFNGHGTTTSPAPSPVVVPRSIPENSSPVAPES